MLRAGVGHKWSFASWIECRGCPVSVLAGQEAAAVRLVNLGVDQRIHLGVHHQVAMFLRLGSEILHLVRVCLEIEQLDVVQLEDTLQSARLAAFNHLKQSRPPLWFHPGAF